MIALGRRAVATRLTILLLSLAGISACTRAAVPLTPTSAPATPTGEVLEAEGTDNQLPSELAGQYAVVWVPADEKLKLRKPAGISGSVVAEIAYDQRGIQRTSKETRLGSSTWVEIATPAGWTGWVQAWNLTEDIPGDIFCEDVRAVRIVEAFGNAVRSSDGDALARLVNPVRGLTLRYEWWNPDIVIPSTSIANVFTDLTEYQWGTLSGSEIPIVGSFHDVILPLLEDVLEGSPQVSCNVLTAGTTSRRMSWPEEFSNINFYTFHRPTPAGGNRYDWRTWALGIEYVGGSPYLSLLIQYRGDI